MDVGAVHARAARVVLALLRSRRESDLGRAGAGRGIARWQAAAFALGLLSIAVALISPVAWLSGILFSVHMTQHEILMLVSAPLLVFGHPLLALFGRYAADESGMGPLDPVTARRGRVARTH